MNINTEEELFCINFELKTLSELFFYNKAERWVYGFMHKVVEEEHLDRYKFILNRIKNKTVLDMACGAGYGTYLLAKEGLARKVTGIDLDDNAVSYGNYRYQHKDIERIVYDATIYKSVENFETIISFETIEHVPNFNLLIENFYNNLIENGELIISTPITKKTNRNPNNKYHVIEWDFYDFHKLFENKFSIKEIYVQNIVIDNSTTISKIINRLSKKVFRRNVLKTRNFGKKFEKFENQYDMKKCTQGYQMLILQKK